MTATVTDTSTLIHERRIRDERARDRRIGLSAAPRRDAGWRPRRSHATAATPPNEQYFPLQSYRVGPYAAGGSGFFGGFIDYLQLINPATAASTA